jgi:hypothetical protein
MLTTAGILLTLKPSLIDQYPEAKLFVTNYLEIYSKAVALPPKTNLKIK